MAEAVSVQGLREFNRSLRKLDSDLPKALRVALNGAVDLVIDDARPKIPRRTGRAAASLKGASTRTSARVRAGGKRAPYYPWLDFGGRVGRRKSVHRTFYKEGRYLFATYAKHRDSGDFTKALTNALVAVAESAGLEVS